MAEHVDGLEWWLQRSLTTYGADLALSLPVVEAVAAPARAAAPTPPPPPEAAAIPRSQPAAPTAPAATPEPRPRAPQRPQDPVKEELEETKALRALRSEVLPCTKCKLHEHRQYTVFGEGNHQARVMFVGEAPGSREDQTGRPFVGRAGQLLERIIQGAMGLQRSDVYIANINKCHPPGNRNPEPDEVAACLPYLRRQIEIIQPEVLVCLGRVAGQNLLSSTESTTALRRRQHEYCGIPVIVTWHPAYLLRAPQHKRDTWDDIKKVNRLLGLPEVPERP